MSKRNYYRLNQDPWNDEVYKPEMTAEELNYLSPTETYKRIKEKRMVNEPSNEDLEQVEEVSAEDWNAACDHWDMLHDLHGLEGF